MIRFVIIALAALTPAAAVAESPDCCATAETAARGPAWVWFRSESAERQAVAVTRGPGQGATGFLPAAGLAAGAGDACGPAGQVVRPRAWRAPPV